MVTSGLGFRAGWLITRGYGGPWERFVRVIRLFGKLGQQILVRSPWRQNASS